MPLDQVLGLPLEFMEFGPKTASLSLLFGDDVERSRFVAALQQAGVCRKGDRAAVLAAIAKVGG